MKNNQHSQKTSAPLHIQELAHSRKKPTQIILKFFVWILIISFVTTIGVTWGGANASYGSIVSTKNTKLDLSPGGFFIREREAVYRQLSEENSNADPRLINQAVNNNALRRSEALALRNDFLNEVKLTPSPETVEVMRRNTGLASPSMINYYYGAQSLFSQMGVFFTLGEPTISDIYAINDISRIEIAAEGLMFSLTNFYASKISPEEKEAFYLKHASLWADRVVAASFSTESRSNAFKLAQTLTNAGSFAEGLAAANKLLASGGVWSNSRSKAQEIILPQPATFELFKAGVSAFQNKDAKMDFAASAPIYANGRYTVLFVSSVGSYDALNSFLQQMMLNDMVGKNYKDLDKKYKNEWVSAAAALKKGVEENKSFAELAQATPGLRLDASQPFSPLSGGIASVSGADFAVPLIQEAPLMASLLISKKPELIASKDNADTYYAVRALNIKTPSPEELAIDINAAGRNMQNLQNIFTYRSTMLDQGLSFGLKDRYNLKSNKALLTNFTVNAGQ